MYQLLVRQRVFCTRSEVRRAYAQLGILGKPARVRTTNSRHEHERYPNVVKEFQATRPNQVWVADTTEFRIAGRRTFLALVEDVFTRLVMGLALSHSNDTLLTLEALEMGLLSGRPEIHHSDQGTTYAAESYTRRLLKLGVVISMAAAGKAWENGFAERLNRTFKEEEILRSEYDNIQDARKAIFAYTKLYNELRIHMSLGYRTPKEVKDTFGQDQETGE